jgi:putative DNA primase/helicase
MDEQTNPRIQEPEDQEKETHQLNDPEKIQELVSLRVEQEQNDFQKIKKESINSNQRFPSSVTLKALDENQDGDASLLVKLHKDRMRFDHGLGKWFQFKGHNWQEDLIDQATATIKDIIDVYAKEAAHQAWEKLKAAKAKNREDSAWHAENEEKLLKRVWELQRVSRKRDVLYLARAGKGSLGISGSGWDRDPMVLGCKNGVVDLAKGTFRSGKPDDYIKTFAPTKWMDLNLECPMWENFISEIFNDDIDLIDYVQRLFGYGLTGKTVLHILPILWGPGRNGKGVLLETLKYVLGPLACKAESELLLEQKMARHSGSPSADVMSLMGKRFVWVSETNRDRKLNTSKVKELVGGDTLSARPPYGKRQIEFSPSHLLFLLTNHRPKVPATDYALWQRIHLIPFTVSFVQNPVKQNEKKVDPELPEKLQKEAPGILAWLVRGCLEWQAKGLNPPATVLAATEKYQKDEDLIGHFIDDCCIQSSTAEVKAGPLYEAYKRWCEDMGHGQMSGTRFGKEIKDRYDSYTSGWVHYVGIGIREG